MVDIKSAYSRAKSILDKETIYNEINYYLVLDESYLFVSCSNNEYKDWDFIIVNKKGGKSRILNYYGFIAKYKNVNLENLISIDKIEDEIEKSDFSMKDLEINESLKITKRDIIFNLVEKGIPLRSILSADKKGITINNINKMKISDFAIVYGQARTNIFNAIKSIANEKDWSLNDISIYALVKRGISETLCKELVKLGIDKVYKLYLIPEEIFYSEYNCVKATADKYYKALKKCEFALVNDENTQSFVKVIEKKDNYQKCIMFNIHNIINKYPEGIKKFTLKQKLDTRFASSTLIDQLIDKMVEEKIIKQTSLGFVANEVTIKEYFKYLPSNFTNDLLKRYILENLTFEHLGDELGVTRQRVDQLIRHEFPKLYEDKYSDFYKKYCVYEKDFCELLNVEPYVYKYLSYKYTKNKKLSNLEDLLDNDNLSEEFKKKLEKIYNNCLFINNEKVLKTKKSLIKYYMKNNIREISDISVILEGFKEFIDSNYPDYDKGLQERDIKTVLLEESVPVLSSSESKYRYYDIYNEELENFIEKLNLNQYKDIELSTLYLFNLNKDLMIEYDIQNEYELHNLLRKINKNTNIKFKKPPHIQIGEGNRDRQLDELILEMAPIKPQELAKEYSERYGTNIGTILNDIDKKYKDIIENGCISLDNIRELSSEEIQKFKSLIDKKELIFKNELSVKLHELGINIDIFYAKKNLNKLGFVSNSTYIYSNKYSSMTEYLEKVFFSQDFIDTTMINRNLIYTSIFTDMINEKRINLDIIEFESGKFINVNLLISKGIQLEQLKDFVNKVKEFSFGKGVFTIKTLINQGFNHSLLDLCFEDIFYSSILRSDTRFNYKRIKDIVLFENSNETHQISVTNILEEILFRYRKMDEYELATYIDENYGLDYYSNLWDLKKYIKDTTIYYDKYTNTYYYNYDVYFKEV